MSKDLRPRDLESDHTSEVRVKSNEDLFPIEGWYESIRDLPFNKFTAQDLARACRQNLFLEQIVPIAIEKLNGDPLLGEYYDGELLASLACVEDNFWRQHSAECAIVVRVADRAVSMVEVDDQDLAQQLRSFVARLSHLRC